MGESKVEKYSEEMTREEDGDGVFVKQKLSSVSTKRSVGQDPDALSSRSAN